MRQVRWASWLMVGALGVALGGLQPVGADVTSDRATAIVTYPLVVASTGSDTVIQLGNASTDPVTVHCFYENANSHCSNDGTVCLAAGDCCGSGGCGICEPGWNETDFRVILTPLQPVGWLASQGMSSFPIDGLNRTGVGGSSNAGSRIPPVAESPFIGALTCIAVDDNEAPVDRNVLKGEATIETIGSPFDVADYNAVGVEAIPGANNGDNTLVLGGDGAEYNGCPNVLILDHFFEGAEDPVSGDTINTQLVLVPCTVDFLHQMPATSVVQYLVYNEFEQRFSTSRKVDCQQALDLSQIDTTQPERSIFSTGVAGTLTGQSRLTPLGSGLVGVAIERHGKQSAGFNVHYQGQRASADTITLP